MGLTHRLFSRRAQSHLVDQLVERADNLSSTELELVLKFVEQIIVNYDPDAIEEFLAWREDPRIESILQIAASLDDAARDQLLFDAETHNQSSALP